MFCKCLQNLLSQDIISVVAITNNSNRAIIMIETFFDLLHEDGSWPFQKKSIRLSDKNTQTEKTQNHNRKWVLFCWSHVWWTFYSLFSKTHPTKNLFSISSWTQNLFKLTLLLWAFSGASESWVRNKQNKSKRARAFFCRTFNDCTKTANISHFNCQLLDVVSFLLRTL